MAELLAEGMSELMSEGMSKLMDGGMYVLRAKVIGDFNDSGNG